MAKTQIQEYVFKPGIGLNDNLYPNAYDMISSNLLFIEAEATEFLEAQALNEVPGYIDYNYLPNDATSIENILNAFIFDLRYGGNAKTVDVIRFFYEKDVFQMPGGTTAVSGMIEFIGNLITENILSNQNFAARSTETQTILDVDAEEDAFEKVESLITLTRNVIDTGLDAIAETSTGAGHVKIQGRYNLADILLVTNVNTNTILYNFGDPDLGGDIELNIGDQDPDFPTYLQTTDTVTTLKFNTNTLDQNESDGLQIFVENSENAQSITTVRPFDFGTDAIERMRVATPYSMLDADFEYGLQPTKWAAIGVQRGYPSLYEIPGTDTPVSTVTTDASFGNTTEDFSYELTNNGSSDWIVSGADRSGSIINEQDPGFLVREGDRLEFTNNASSTHPLYLKTVSEAGTNNLIEGVDGQGAFGGDTVTWQTTLGDSGTYYYTCANHSNMIGVITVEAADSNTGVGQSEITVNTVTPHGVTAGEPITIKALEDGVVGAARAEGAFVVTETPDENTLRYFAKAKVGSAPGDILSTTYTQLRRAGFYTGASIGTPSFELISNGSEGTITTELEVASESTIIPYDGINPPVGSPIVGNASIGQNTQVTGVIQTSAGGGTYITVEIDGDYTTGETLVTLVDASGVVPNLAFDSGNGVATFVQSINGNNIILSDPLNAPLLGTTNTYTNISGTNDNTSGSGANFDVTVGSGVYEIASINNGGVAYKAGDRLLVSGTNLGGGSPEHDLVMVVEIVDDTGSIQATSQEGTPFDGTETVSNISPQDEVIGSGVPLFDVSYTDNVYSVSVSASDASQDYAPADRLLITGTDANGQTPDNDVIVTVSTVDASGKITGVTSEGTAPDAALEFADVPYQGGTGTAATFTVRTLGEIYALEITAPGTGYVIGDNITVIGSDIGGSSPENDLTVTIDNVDGAGGITEYIISGTANNSDSVNDITATNVLGSGLEVTVSLDAGAYTLNSVDQTGSAYAPDQTFLIPGSALYGVSPDNDLNFTVTTVDATGAVTGASVSGTAAQGGGTFTVTGSPQQPIGENATFNVERISGTYEAFVNNGGTDYKAGNRIVLSGDDLGGSSPTNDVTVRVNAVDSSSAILSVLTEDNNAPVAPDYDLISTVLLSEPTEDIIPRQTEIDYKALATLEAQFENAHGLVPGSTFIVTIQSESETNNHDLAAGSFIATDIPSATRLRFQARTSGTILEEDQINGSIYPRPDSFFIHRPFDGGVQLGTGGPQHGAQAIRQSKKYIRYQSGKGIMYTTGALFAPSYDIRSVEAEDVEVGSLITVTTDDNDHGLQVGGIVRLLGVETPGYNSGPSTALPPAFDYEVNSIIDERTFTIRAQRRLGDTTAVLGFDSQVSVIAWHGATVRSGIFDDQNGIFWEFDGTQISVVQRTGTKQIAGTVSVTVDSNLINGNNTKFRDQLKAGDRLVIKGMTHVISHVIDQTTMTVTPDWRGVVDVYAAKANLVIDKKVKQKDFNLDRLDGTGPSGYDVDIAKMQMIGIQYSWYGAGFIDFMLRGADGDFVYAHRMRNSNVNTEAFMRSGNLPVRYEVTNEGPPGKLAEPMSAEQDFLELEDSSFFPDSGVLYIDNEIITFSGKGTNGNRLIGLNRGANYVNYQAGASRNYTAGFPAEHAARTGVILLSNTITPLISHWGSAFITDGQFDDDRGYLFSYSETGVNISTTRKTAFMLRLAPSVSNALVGDLGERELLNRAQLLLDGIEITSQDGNGGIVVEGLLNPQNYPVDPDSVSWQGLQSLAQGGQPSFAQIAPGGGIDWTTNDTVTTETVTTQSDLQGTASIEFNRRNRDYMYVLRNDWESLNAAVGDFVINSAGGANFGSGLRIRLVRGPYNFRGTRYYIIYTDGRYNGTTSGNITVERRFTTTDRSFAFVDNTTYSASGVKSGTDVSETGGSVTFPGGTSVASIEEQEFNGTTYLRLSFNNSYEGTLSDGSGTIEFEFSQPPYAQPGEQVFSFIAVPGERSTLKLDSLKEITNTPLGGRGTFPNGPDVLAINVYKVSGQEIDGNIILKWGEAQA